MKGMGTAEVGHLDHKLRQHHCVYLLQVEPQLPMSLCSGLTVDLLMRLSILSPGGRLRETDREELVRMYL